ncbi:hypothetical protein GCM10022255_094170 [Dactylosporangium darangshiense]|uniref:Glyoxalase-like domain-containing protein n=1 Tax=Dactylosporangium darangshiense TaxID=579108 RepID=A0ABP8DQ15_9ACTN
MLVGRLHDLIVDCPDPAASARFWSAMLGQPITHDDPDFVVVSRDTTTSGLAFQRAPDHRPPTWPDPTVLQQLHHRPDPAAAGRAVLAVLSRLLRRRWPTCCITPATLLRWPPPPAAATTRPEAIRLRLEPGLPLRLQRVDREGLQRPVGDHRNPQSAAAPVALGHIHPLDRTG